MLTLLRTLAALALGSVLTAAAQAPPVGQRVFICGHSFHVMMSMPLEQIAQAAGIKGHLQVGTLILGGSSVNQHWETPEDKSEVKAAIAEGKVDVLTVSPNGKLIPDPGIEKFADLLLANNPEGRVLVQASWPAMDGHLDRNFKNTDRDNADPAQIRKRVEPINRTLSRSVEVLNKKYQEKPGRQVVFLVPAGEAVCVLRERVVAGKAPGIARQSELFRDDRGHCFAHIAVLVGYCHYAVIYQRSPVGLPVPEALKKAGLGQDTGALNRVLQEVAWETVTREPLSGVP